MKTANFLGKKSNERTIVCILIKTINLYELILAVVPLCYEFYSLYSANSARRDSLSAHWAVIWVLFTFWYSVSVAKTTEPVKNLMQSA